MAQATSAPSIRSGKTTPTTIQLHAEAHNALVMALHYIRQPDANVAGAARKTVQALAALRRVAAAEEVSHG